jgi:hypothetical protein
MSKSKREAEFQNWLNGPEARRISSKDYGTELGGSQKMIEDLLRSAFEGGFQSCLAEVRSKLRGLGAAAPKPDPAPETGSASAARSRKGV